MHSANDPSSALPSAVDCERCVLSSMMNAPDFAVPAVTGLRAGDFSVAANGLLFDVMVQQFEAGKLVDLVSLTQVFYDRDLMSRIEGPAYLSEICTASVSPEHVKHYAAIVKEKSAQRDAVKAGWALSNSIMVDPEQWQVHCATAVEAIIAATSGTSKRATIVHIREAVKEAVDAFERAAMNKGHVPDGLCTGFTHLDRCLWGLKPGDNVNICGATGMGKTALAVNILVNMSSGRGHYQEYFHNKAGFEIQEGARQGKLKTVLVCLESPQAKMASRAISGLSGVTMQRIRDGFVQTLDWHHLKNAVSVLDGGEFHVWDITALNVEDLELELKAFKARNPDLRAVCVDHCGLLRARGVSEKATDYQRISYISTRLRDLWRTLNVVGLPLWQLSRKIADRGDKKPRLADLRDSGNIEQDATHVVAVHRPHYFDSDEPEDDALLCVLKNRDGATNGDGIPVKWDGQTTLFTSTSDKLFSNNDSKRQGAMPPDAQRKEEESPSGGEQEEIDF